MFYALRLFFSNGGCNKIPLGLVVHLNVTVSTRSGQGRVPLLSSLFNIGWVLSNDLIVPAGTKRNLKNEEIHDHPLADKNVDYR